MRKTLLILFAIFSLLYGCDKDNNEPTPEAEPEVTLFDKQAKPIVYISYADNDSTIYMWDGSPVAYLKEKGEIYHFNGQFLGWYTDGILYGKDGYVVAAKKGVKRGEIIMNDTYTESIKEIKHIKPVPYLRSLPPVTPQFKDEWSINVTSLPVFFMTEISLFDKDKKAIAYIDYSNDATIYMWDGTPVAYVEEREQIYHFDGQFLGWYIDGILYDKNGNAVAAEKGVLKGAISMLIPQVEPVKSFKTNTPAKETKAQAPTRPHLENSWSETTLADFLLSK